jgi:pyrroloquinoline quinone (PQQ) biosynthesis protein C
MRTSSSPTSGPERRQAHSQFPAFRLRELRLPRHADDNGIIHQEPPPVVTQPFFIDLITRTDEARRSFETNASVLRMVASGLSLERYRNLLLELYHVVWHFNPTCAAAASRIGSRQSEIRYFLYDHMMEEKGHEEWVINDLEVVGIGRAEALRYQPSNALLALNGYNYWTADRRNPCGVLGMVYALEVIASVYGGPIAAAISESLFLEGNRGISFITSHVTMDAEHMAELRVLMNKIHESDAQEAIVESAVFNLEQFTRVLEAV